MTKRSPFRYFKTSPEIIRLAVMMYVRFPLSLLHERGIDVSHETVRFWWNRFGPMFAAEIRRKRASRMRAYSNWQWHLDEVFVKINGETHYLWRAVDHEGEVLETGERGKTIRLSRTRQKIAREGVQKTLADLTLQSAPSEGYFLLRDRNMLDLSAEAVVLRFPNQFGEKVLQAARVRLEADDGVNTYQVCHIEL